MRYLPPEVPEEPKEKEDRVKITALVILIISGLVAVFAASCVAGIFPLAMLGGHDSTFFTLFGAGVIAAISGAVFVYKWKLAKPDASEDAQ